MNHDLILRRYRLVLGAFIVGLILSGITAFPLLHELEMLGQLLGIPSDAAARSQSGLRFWIATVRDGLRATHAAYPWLAYGTDWLAFGHIVIALFFIGPWRDPVPNAWVLKTGLVACAGVLVVAMTCGPIRGIPLYWRMIDGSFGVFGAVPLLNCLQMTKCLKSLD